MKYNKKKAEKMAIYAVVIIVIILVVGNYIVKSEVFKNETASYESQLVGILESETFEEKIDALKKEVRDKIMNGESAGIITVEGELFPTFDPYNAILDKCRRIGGKMDLDCLSFGPLQFKLSTIILYEKELNGNDITEMEALVIAHDIELASQLFDDIVYGVEGGIWNWSVAYHDVEYYETVVPIVRKLVD